MCSGRQYESIDMQHDLFGSGHHLDLRSNFQHDLSRSNYTSFDASRKEKNDACKINVVSLLSQQLLQKTPFRKKRLFLEREMMFFVLQRRRVAIRLPRLTVMTSVIFFASSLKILTHTGTRTPDLWISAPMLYLWAIWTKYFNELSAKLYADYS